MRWRASRWTQTSDRRLTEQRNAFGTECDLPIVEMIRARSRAKQRRVEPAWNDAATELCVTATGARTQKKMYSNDYEDMPYYIHYVLNDITITNRTNTWSKARALYISLYDGYEMTCVVTDTKTYRTYTRVAAERTRTHANYRQKSRTAARDKKKSKYVRYYFYPVSNVNANLRLNCIQIYVYRNNKS